MFVVRDALAHAIGFMVELALVALGEVAVVLRHVSLFVVLQALFAAFEARRLSRLELAVLYAIGNAVLLVRFALIDLIDARMAGIDLSSAGARSVAGLGLSRGRSDQHQTACCQD